MLSVPYFEIVGEMLAYGIGFVSAEGEPEVRVETDVSNVETMYYPTLYYSVTASDGGGDVWTGEEDPLVTVELELSIYADGEHVGADLNRLIHRIHRGVKAMCDISYSSEDKTEYTRPLRAQCVSAISPGLTVDVGGKAAVLLSGRYSMTFKETYASHREQ